MTPSILKHLNSMRPYDTIIIAQSRDPDGALQAIKEYIDEYGTMQFNDDYSIATKLHAIPPVNTRLAI